MLFSHLSNLLDMKFFYWLPLLLFPLFLNGQSRPSYCDGAPVAYDNAGLRKGVSLAGRGSGSSPVKLPQFNTDPTTEYKVQVAILRYSSPTDHPFHDSLVARYRPCEEVWVVESRNSYTSRTQAEKLKRDLIRLGYKGAYITELIGYQ